MTARKPYRRFADEPTPPAAPNPPRYWTDEGQVAVADYVDQIIAAVLRGDPYDYPELYRLCPLSIWAEHKLKAHRLEEEAVEFAEAGNPAALAALLRSDHPANDEEFNVAPWDRNDWHGAMLPSAVSAGTIRSTLAPRTYELIADILEGRIRRKKSPDGTPPGAPPRTHEQRRAKNPVHDAKDWLPMIKAILRRAYETQGDDHIHDQAIFVAARRLGISRKRLRNHLARSPLDHRLLPTIP